MPESKYVKEKKIWSHNSEVLYLNLMEVHTSSDTYLNWCRHSWNI